MIKNIIMVTSFYGKHLITLPDWSTDEIDSCLDVAYDLKLKFARRIPHTSLRDETLFMLYFDESTRTRNSTEASTTQLGAHAHYLDAKKMQINHGDNAKDTAMSSPALADLMTIEEHFGRTKAAGLKISVIWCYSATHKKLIFQSFPAADAATWMT